MSGNEVEEDNASSASSSDEDKDEDHDCGTCGKTVDGDCLLCEVCNIWYHRECQEINKTQYKMIKNTKSQFLVYRCKSCIEISSNSAIVQLSAKFDDLKKEFKYAIGALMDQIDELKEDKVKGMGERKTIIKKIDEIKKSDNQSYADKLKIKEKNTLVVTSTVEGSKACENKKEILNSLKRFQIENVKTAKKAHIILHFTDKVTMEKAKQEIDKKKEENKTETKMKKKMYPKIMISHVSIEEEEKDIIDNILSKNPWLRDLDLEMKNEDMFQVVASTKPKGGTRHYVLKCNPQIRKAIFDNGSYLYTGYGRSKVRDKYRVFQCYKCQEFGHNADNCKNDQQCAKCGGMHRLKECKSNTMKCVNCQKAGRPETDHWSNSYKCPSYVEEEAKVRNNTDHGL